MSAKSVTTKVASLPRKTRFFLGANWLVPVVLYTFGVSFGVSVFRVAFIVWRSVSGDIDTVLADF